MSSVCNMYIVFFAEYMLWALLTSRRVKSCTHLCSQQRIRDARPWMPCPWLHHQLAWHYRTWGPHTAPGHPCQDSPPWYPHSTTCHSQSGKGQTTLYLSFWFQWRMDIFHPALVGVQGGYTFDRTGHHLSAAWVLRWGLTEGPYTYFRLPVFQRWNRSPSEHKDTRRPSGEHHGSPGSPATHETRSGRTCEGLCRSFERTGWWM